MSQNGDDGVEVLHVAALYEEHAGWLRRYMRNLAENWAVPPNVLDPDDVVQEAFASLLRCDRRIQNPGAWLCVVARNQVTKAAQHPCRIAREDPTVHLEAGTDWTSLSRRADAEVIMAARAIVDAIAELPGNQQVATYLSRVAG
jgi:DNA-directed RNA polymerase specialized sigma24 family protein